MMYVDQKPRVWSKPERPDNGVIRVTFGPEHDPVTLALTTTQASCLAENIQREIRDLHRHEVASATPLTVELRRALRVGDRVVVQMYHGHPVGDEIHTVTGEPWQLGHGAWVVKLDGISGGYDLSRVVGILSTESSRGPK